MILGNINEFDQYRHIETARIVRVSNPNLLVKIDNVISDTRWITCVDYVPDDAGGEHFAVPIDDFRKKFEHYIPGDTATPEEVEQFWQSGV